MELLPAYLDLKEKIPQVKCALIPPGNVGGDVWIKAVSFRLRVWSWVVPQQMQAAALSLWVSDALVGTDTLLVPPASVWPQLLERGRDGTSGRVCLPPDKPVRETPRAPLHPPAVPRQPNSNVGLTTFI